MDILSTWEPFRSSATLSRHAEENGCRPGELESYRQEAVDRTAAAAAVGVRMRDGKTLSRPDWSVGRSASRNDRTPGGRFMNF